MINVEPGSKYVISRQIGNHQDSTTYYSRATIRNAKTDALIDRVSLVDRGDRRFSQQWDVPGDPTGLGIYFSIVTEVFTDSGFTTKGKYQDEMDTIFVKEDRQSFGGGSGGTPIDYEKLAKIFTGILDLRVPELVKIPGQEKVDLSDINFNLQDIKKAVSEIEIPEYKDQDLSPLLEGIRDVVSQMKSGFENALKEIKKAVDDKEIPEVDLNPVIERIDAIREGLKGNQEQFNRLVAALETGVPNYNKKLEKAKIFLEEFLETPSPLVMAISGEKEEGDEEKKEKKPVKDFAEVARKIMGRGKFRFPSPKK